MCIFFSIYSIINSKDQSNNALIEHVTVEDGHIYGNEDNGNHSDALSENPEEDCSTHENVDKDNDVQEPETYFKSKETKETGETPKISCDEIFQEKKSMVFYMLMPPPPSSKECNNKKKPHFLLHSSQCVLQYPGLFFCFSSSSESLIFVYFA